MMLTAANLATLRSACDNLGFSIRRYSGRAMYGSYCLGIEVERGVSTASVAFRLALELSSMGEEDILEDLASVEWSQDSMGMGGIMYASSLRWAENEEEEECEDEEPELDDPMTYNDEY